MVKRARQGAVERNFAEIGFELDGTVREQCVCGLPNGPGGWHLTAHEDMLMTAAIIIYHERDMEFGCDLMSLSELSLFTRKTFGRHVPLDTWIGRKQSLNFPELHAANKHFPHRDWHSQDPRLQHFKKYLESRCCIHEHPDKQPDWAGNDGTTTTPGPYKPYSSEWARACAKARNWKPCDASVEEIDWDEMEKLVKQGDLEHGRAKMPACELPSPKRRKHRDVGRKSVPSSFEDSEPENSEESHQAEQSGLCPVQSSVSPAVAATQATPPQKSRPPASETVLKYCFAHEGEVKMLPEEVCCPQCCPACDGKHWRAGGTLITKVEYEKNRAEGKNRYCGHCEKAVCVVEDQTCCPTCCPPELCDRKHHLAGRMLY